MSLFQQHRFYRRLIFPSSGRNVNVNITVVTNRVYLVPIEIPFPLYVDCIYVAYGATSAGNLNAGIYYAGATPNDPDGGALIVSALGIAKTGAWSNQLITIAETLLNPGLYYVAYQSDENTTVIGGILTVNILGVPRQRTYDPAGFALTNPCPVTADNTVPFLALRVSRVGD